MLITILSSQAQEESRNLSENTHWGIVRKFEQGIVLINHTKFMGYTKDSDGKLVVVPEEADVVRKIFDLYLQGLGASRIAKALEDEGIKTATNNDKWHRSTIHKMLQCEKYMGDAMLQKTYTVDFLSKKRVANDGIAKRYYIKNNHEPIISREQYYQVQEELKRRKNEAVNGTRYSSKYPLSGLITCGECGSRYTRCTWYQKDGKVVVWRCNGKLQSGISRCVESCNLKENKINILLLDLFNYILMADTGKSSAMILQTRAVIVIVFGNDEIRQGEIEDVRLNEMIDSIISKTDRQIEIRFKSGLVITKHLG